MIKSASVKVPDFEYATTQATTPGPAQTVSSRRPKATAFFPSNSSVASEAPAVVVPPKMASYGEVPGTFGQSVTKGSSQAECAARRSARVRESLRYRGTESVFTRKGSNVFQRAPTSVWWGSEHAEPESPSASSTSLERMRPVAPSRYSMAPD